MSTNRPFSEKYLSKSEAVALVKSDQTIGVGIAGSEPVGLLTALAERYQEVENVHCWTCLPMHAY